VLAVFGASVTAQKNGYAEQLKEFIPIKIQKYGYGGMHLNDAGICFLNKVAKSKPRYCFLDWFSTIYNECTEKTIECIDTIVHHFSTIDCRVVFLFLPYKNNEKKQTFYHFCKDVLDKRLIAYIDISNSAEVENLELILRDDIHTNDFGSKLYARLIAEKFLKLQHSLIVNQVCKKTKYTDILMAHIEKTFYDKVVLVGQCEIIGILLTIGPHSGKVLIKYTNGEGTENTWDKSCYYPRQHFNLSITVKDKTELHVLADKFDTSTCKTKMKFERIKKKLIIHDIYYTGKNLSIKNIKDGKPINKFSVSLIRVRGRIVQKINNLKKKLMSIVI
jgi:hypothetical protein